MAITQYNLKDDGLKFIDLGLYSAIVTAFTSWKIK